MTWPGRFSARGVPGKRAKPFDILSDPEHKLAFFRLVGMACKLQNTIPLLIPLLA